MDRWVGRVAVVTGASAGIGAAIATSLVRAGMKVIWWIENCLIIVVGLRRKNVEGEDRNSSECELEETRPCRGEDVQDDRRVCDSSQSSTLAG